MPSAVTGSRLTAVSTAVTASLELAGKALDVPTQRRKMLGDLPDFLAESLVAWHFGVVLGHVVLLCLVPACVSAPRHRGSRRIIYVPS